MTVDDRMAVMARLLTYHLAGEGPADVSLPARSVSNDSRIATGCSAPVCASPASIRGWSAPTAPRTTRRALVAQRASLEPTRGSEKNLMDTTNHIATPDSLIPADGELAGLDSNAGAIMGAVSRGLQRAGNDQSVIDQFRAECMSGDYKHLLQAAIAYMS